jgi:hypothetical protein
MIIIGDAIHLYSLLTTPSHHFIPVTLTLTQTLTLILTLTLTLTGRSHAYPWHFPPQQGKP